MRDIRIAAAQFEHRDNDKAYNLSRIESLSREAVAKGAEIVSFHECCISGYTFLQSLNIEQLASIAEAVPTGPSTAKLIDIAVDVGATIMAGLLEQDGDQFFNTYVTVNPSGFVTRFRKLHTFINPHVSSGKSFNVTELRDQQGGVALNAGFLICYDNNLPENVRMTTMLGAEVVFMPHVTGCLPSVMPGRGSVDAKLWHNRERDPARLRKEFDGPKGRQWLHRWLPCRAYENGVYAIYTNPIGVDGDTIKPGGSMILDPFGEIIAECRSLGDEVVVALCTAEKLEQASGRRYIRARRPELYGKLVEPHPDGERPTTEPGWKRSFDPK